MKKLLIALPVILFMLNGCKTEKASDMNPLLAEYKTPFGVPPFDQIRNEHYLPAFREGIKQQEAEIEAIVNNPEAPDFNNTIVALDNSGEYLRKAGGVFYRLRSADTNDEIEKIAEELVPLTSAHNSNILLNQALFDRIRTVYENRENLSLNTEEYQLLDKTYKRFVRGGANLDETDKERLRKIDEDLSMLSLKFGKNLLEETNNYRLVIENEEDLSGLPESVISAAADAASKFGLDGKWVFTLHKPSWIPFLQYSSRRDLREQLYKAVYMCGNNENEYDNKEIIRQMVNLRIERAKMMGYENHADYMLEDRMAKEPENVYEFLMKLWVPALEMAKKESAMMQDMIEREGGSFKLQSWDWWYYAEKIRKEKYDLDEELIRPYLSLETVKDGLFMVVNKLYGLTFELREDLPVYNEEVLAYEVKDADGSHVGILYMDFHPRSSKKSGAWSTSFRQQHIIDGEFITPVNLIVMNFTRPTGNKPALLSFDEALTFFHEFGHALHSLLSECTFLTVSGTSVPRDFVELPSQIMENWAADPEVLKMYAKHFETGEPIPQDLVDKIVASGQFNQGFTTVEYLAASLLDMDYHTLSEPVDFEVNAFEASSMNRIGLIEEIIPRYKSTYFQHIFSGGYSAGYYSYIWAEVLDADAYEAFKENGLFDRETALAFRKNILEKGGSDDPMKLYVAFRGQEPTIEPLLKNRGLN
ncbi:MAG: M3 family metallopeptidase [Bacteroidales bacterium]|nr:M3 family metallopeptidase [Bacteroidales bacterium]MBN2698222.1 M3 family metallopeptidase [Bacteroidales bacterium]